MQNLVLADNLWDDLKSGQKTITIRNGFRDIKLGQLRFDNVSKTQNTLVDVISVRHTKLKYLKYEEMKDDGFSDPSEVLPSMQLFYPDITWDSEITVIEFRQ